MTLRVAVLVLTTFALANAAWWLYEWYQRRRSRRIAPAYVLQRTHGLYAESRPVIRLDPARVPDRLRDLIPLAEKWGIGDDIIRFDFEEKAAPSERDELVRSVAARLTQINAWLETTRATHMSDEAAAFMYMAEAYAEIDAAPTPRGRRPDSS